MEQFIRDLLSDPSSNIWGTVALLLIVGAIGSLLATGLLRLAAPLLRALIRHGPKWVRRIERKATCRIRMKIIRAAVKNVKTSIEFNNYLHNLHIEHSKTIIILVMMTLMTVILSFDMMPSRILEAGIEGEGVDSSKITLRILGLILTFGMVLFTIQFYTIEYMNVVVNTTYELLKRRAARGR